MLNAPQAALVTARSPHLIRLSPVDDVAVTSTALHPGLMVDGIAVATTIPAGHKIAIRAIPAGAVIRKYGQPIGVATTDVAVGDWVHVHNCAMSSFAADHAFGADVQPPTMVPEAERATFMGYRRDGKRAGTRNYLGILTSVNCSGGVARMIARELERSGALNDFPHVDGVVPLSHGGGCAMDADGENHDLLKRTLWGYAANPNMGGVLMVGLGCEVLRVAGWKKAYGLEDGPAFRSLVIQEMGGTRATMAAGVAAALEMLPVIDAARREPVPASELVLALQCGGSDGYSGVTANPALGVAVDLLVAQGGTAILSETPEIYGAEHLLTRRAVSSEVGEALLERLRWWEEYTRRNGMEMNNNPSPGNKAGGLTTILEKSLGAAAKSGSTPLNAVHRYAEPVTGPGFVFMDTPGYDPVSATGQVAGGATVICFTTGRGSTYGCKPTPSIKLATNSAIYRAMPDDMDIDCGDIVEGADLNAKGRAILDLILDVASGGRTKSELLGHGDVEFVPWSIGAIM